MPDQEIKILLAAPTFYSVFQAEISKHLRKQLKSDQIVLRSVTDDPDVQKERLDHALHQTKPSALIAISIRPDPGIVDAYHSADVPIVLIDEKADGVSHITSDNLMGGQLAGRHLASTDRKKIGIVSGRTQVQGGYNAELRIKGFRQGLGSSVHTLQKEHLIEVVHYSRAEGEAVMPKLIDMGLDAVFCAAGDNCALGLVSVAKTRGLLIPDDMAIIGYDDLLAARVSIPALTTIRQPIEEMADAAYQMAVVNRNDILRSPRQAVFKPELVIRQSA
ncbi:substrate-binding domain-containing protein [bacterium]|nr:substrate-binding domain-containing protein [bacterium]